MDHHRIVVHPYWVGQTNENADRRVDSWLEDPQLTRSSAMRVFPGTDVNTSEPIDDLCAPSRAKPTTTQRPWQDDPDDSALIREVRCDYILTLLRLWPWCAGFLSPINQHHRRRAKRADRCAQIVGATRWTRSSYRRNRRVYGIPGPFRRDPGLSRISSCGAIAAVCLTLIEGFKFGDRIIVARDGIRAVRPRCPSSTHARLLPKRDRSRPFVPWGTASGAPDQRPAPRRSICPGAQQRQPEEKPLLLTVSPHVAAAHSWASSPCSPSSMTNRQMFDTFNYDLERPPPSQDYEQ